MRHRVLHSDGSTTSELVLGTWGLSSSAYGPTQKDALAKTVERAVELGVTLVDGAFFYADGQLFSSLRPSLDRFPQLGIMARVGVVAHGGQLIRSFACDRITANVEAILSASGRARLDVCMLHAPSIDDLREGFGIDALRQLVHRGLVRTWGVAVTGVPEAHEAIDTEAPALALPFNAFHQPIYRSIAARARGRGVRVFAHSVLAYGLLAGRWAPGHTFSEDDHRSRRWAPHELAARLDHLAVLRHLVRGSVHSLRAAALRYALQQDAMTALIVGPRSPEQLEDLCRDIERPDGTPLPTEDVVAFEAVARARGLYDAP